jgi:hypothetical protein
MAVLLDADQEGLGTVLVHLKLAVDQPFVLLWAVARLPSEGESVELYL